jgi:hypothetical protein
MALCSIALSWPMRPIRVSASTITNSPATNGITLHDMPITYFMTYEMSIDAPTPDVAVTIYESDDYRQ